jgi:CRISPR-associated protein Csd1
MPELNLNLDAPAYLCGRLLSILESIQRVAIPNLNSTLTDKHYASAAATPGVIFGVLLKDAASAHLPKLRKNRMGAYIALDSALQEVLGKLGEFPRTLNYEGQGLFSLGYYHQKASDISAARAGQNRDLKEIAYVAVEDTESAEDPS